PLSDRVQKMGNVQFKGYTEHRLQTISEHAAMHTAFPMLFVNYSILVSHDGSFQRFYFTTRHCRIGNKSIEEESNGDWTLRFPFVRTAVHPLPFVTVPPAAGPS
ncbi:MAG: hypothetical protein PHF83_03895, partial [Candidatus Methanomethylophilus sp.]|nr:hypothetical protein [Methanomethylophilus sp.]